MQNIKLIGEYKKLFGIEGEIVLADIKKTYRNLVKEWHPDKFQDDGAKAKEAEVKSREIIDAYHVLVSLAPETKENEAAEYETLIKTKTIVDYDYEKRVLWVQFSNGAEYEYFDVKPKLVEQLGDALNQMRFARRKLLKNHLYRKTKREGKEV